MGVNLPDVLINSNNNFKVNDSEVICSKNPLNKVINENGSVKTEDNQLKKLKESPYKFDLTKDPETVEEWLIEIKSLLNNFLIGNVAEAKSIFKQRAHVSFFYEVVCCAFDFLDSLLGLDKENLEIALNSVTNTNVSANKHRKKMGFMGYLIRGDFKDHKDIEAYAEAAHSFTQILNAFIIALLDQGIYQFI